MCLPPFNPRVVRCAVPLADVGVHSVRPVFLSSAAADRSQTRLWNKFTQFLCVFSRSPVGAALQQSQQVTPHTSSEKITPDLEVPVRPPRMGANAASGMRGLVVEVVNIFLM